MSTVQARPRSPKESSRGPEWDRKVLEIAYRDGAYRDTDGRLHKVCRNFAEAKRQGLEAELPPGCARTNGESKVWICHSNSWSKYPALRFVDVNLMGLCEFCDPDRNPAMRANWWGDPRRPVTAGWERRKGGRTSLVASRFKRHHLAGVATLFAAGILSTSHGLPHHALWAWGALGLSLLAWPELGLSTALWVALLALGFHSHRIHAPSTLYGYLGWLAALLALWLACLAAVSFSLAHLLPRLWRWVRR